jgi:hypothetical protein
MRKLLIAVPLLAGLAAAPALAADPAPAGNATSPMGMGSGHGMGTMPMGSSAGQMSMHGSGTMPMHSGQGAMEMGAMTPEQMRAHCAAMGHPVSGPDGKPLSDAQIQAMHRNCAAMMSSNGPARGAKQSRKAKPHRHDHK